MYLSAKSASDLCKLHFHKRNNVSLKVLYLDFSGKNYFVEIQL